MKQPLVSIILPVYNAQSHLARCLSSICAQTYQNLEIIVLNDGSKDQSLPVCEEFRKKDPRIILVDKANSGVSDTRNLGLKLATGEYIQFVDSDDYIDPDYTGHLVAAAEEHHADLVIAPYKMVIPAGASKPEQVLEKLEQAVLPQHDALVFPEQRHRLLLKDPAHRVVDIVKMVVKMLARHAAAPHDLRHGDPVQGFLGHQLLEYSADLPLGRIAGLVCPFFHIDLHGPADSSPLQSSITHFPEECIYAEWGQVSDF